MENKTQSGASDNSADSQREEFEFTDDPIKPVRSDEDSSVSDKNRQEATKEKHVQPRGDHT